MEELAGWREIIFLFLVASGTGTIVCVTINQFIKSHPVLVVQISMLITLFMYPVINSYLFILLGSDYESLIYGRMEYLSYNSVMFFAPLPVCILVTAIFFLLRKRKKTEKLTEPSPKVIKSGILKKTATLATFPHH